MILRPLLCLTVIAMLAACGTGGQQSGLYGPLQNTFSGFLNRNAPKPTAASVRAALTPEVRATFGNSDLKIAVLEEQNLASLLIENTRNADVTTYLTPDGVSVSLQQGVLVGTRGLGFDLMTADVAQAIPAIRRGGQGVVRVHRYLDGEERVVIRSFICDYSRGATVTEDCVSEGFSIRNTYNVIGGRIASSRQWISPERGYLRIEATQ